MGRGGSSRDRFAFCDGTKSFGVTLSNLGVAGVAPEVDVDSATLHTPVHASDRLSDVFRKKLTSDK